MISLGADTVETLALCRKALSRSSCSAQAKHLLACQWQRFVKHTVQVHFEPARERESSD